MCCILVHYIVVILVYCSKVNYTISLYEAKELPSLLFRLASGQRTDQHWMVAKVLDPKPLKRSIPIGSIVVPFWDCLIGF